MEFNAALQQQFVDNLGIVQVEHVPLEKKKLWWFFITDWLNGFLLWLCYFTVLAILVAVFASYEPVVIVMSLCATCSFLAAICLGISTYYKDHRVLLPFIVAQVAQAILFATAKFLELKVIVADSRSYSIVDFGMGFAFAIINCPITTAICIFGIIIGLRGYQLFKARGKPKSAPNTARLDELPIAPIEGTSQQDERPKELSPSNGCNISNW